MAIETIYGIKQEMMQGPPRVDSTGHHYPCNETDARYRIEELNSIIRRLEDKIRYSPPHCFPGMMQDLGARIRVDTSLSPAIANKKALVLIPIVSK